MGLNVIFVLLICSVVIASGKSCENDGIVTAQDVKYSEDSKGFFYMLEITSNDLKFLTNLKFYYNVVMD